MSGQENSESPNVKLMHEWGRGFVEKDIDLIASHLHRDYRHITYPRSLGMPEEGKEQYLQHMKGVFTLWIDNESTVNSIIEAPGKVIVHVTSKMKTVIGVDTIRESIYIAQIVPDENGSLKVKQIEDFTDSKAHLDFVQAVMAKQSRAS